MNFRIGHQSGGGDGVKLGGRAYIEYFEDKFFAIVIKWSVIGWLEVGSLRGSVNFTGSYWQNPKWKRTAVINCWTGRHFNLIKTIWAKSKHHAVLSVASIEQNVQLTDTEPFYDLFFSFT